MLLSLSYTRTRTHRPQEEEEGGENAEEGVVHLHPEEPGVVFDDGAVEEARAVFGRIVGEGEGDGQSEGFMRLPEEARRLLDEMEEA